MQPPTRSDVPARRAGAPHPDDRIHVTDDALGTVIGLAAHEVPGVVGMAPSNLGEGLRRILGVAQANEGVEIVHADEDAEGAATGGGAAGAPERVEEVCLRVVVAYGVNIPAVADSVRERVLYAARTYAGVEVERVRVQVVGVSRG